MNKYSDLLTLVFAIAFITSCTKNDTPAIPSRTIKFILYTEEDFSTDNHNITFSLFIRTHSKTLFDSTLSTIKTKDIPNFANRLIFEEAVPNDDGSDLAVGFNYTIENVGMSAMPSASPDRLLKTWINRKSISPKKNGLCNVTYISI